MIFTCRSCGFIADFNSLDEAKASGWELLEIRFCPEHATQHDYIYCVRDFNNKIHFGVMEVNNQFEAEAKLRVKFPSAKNVGTFNHIGEEQEETL